MKNVNFIYCKFFCQKHKFTYLLTYYAEFLAYYTLENKSRNSCEYQPDELDGSLIEKNHEESSYPMEMKLTISGERMQCCKVRRRVWYHVPNKILYSEKFAHHVLLLFCPFRDEKELLSGLPPLYQNKLQEQGVQDIVTLTKLNLSQTVWWFSLWGVFSAQ